MRLSHLVTNYDFNEFDLQMVEEWSPRMALIWYGAGPWNVSPSMVVGDNVTVKVVAPPTGQNSTTPVEACITFLS